MRLFKGLNERLRRVLQGEAAGAKAANIEEAGKEAGHKLLAEVQQEA